MQHTYHIKDKGREIYRLRAERGYKHVVFSSRGRIIHIFKNIESILNTDANNYKNKSV